MLSEHSEQVLLINWVRANQKRYPELQTLFAVPNGGGRDIMTAKKLKAEGVLAGVPDLLLPVARQGFHGLFIELKIKGNTVSKNQTWYINKAIEQGYAVQVCYGHDEAINAIKGYLGI